MNNDLKNRFTYHSPNRGQGIFYEQFRAAALQLALMLDDNAYKCQER